MLFVAYFGRANGIILPMDAMFIFRTNYFILTLILLLTEVLIAVSVHDMCIRPYAGDLLVVIFLYCLVRSFLKVPVLHAMAGVLLFAFGIEILQYFHFIVLLGLQHSTVARMVLGTSFSWMDLVVYVAGGVVVMVVERWRGRLDVV